MDFLFIGTKNHGTFKSPGCILTKDSWERDPFNCTEDKMGSKGLP